MVDKKILTIGVFSLLGALLFGAFYVSAHGFGNGVDVKDGSSNAEKGIYHEQMKEIIENGTYADLVALRKEFKMNFMPWVTDEETFQQLTERHEQMEAYMGDVGLSCMGNNSTGFGMQVSNGFEGCPMMQADNGFEGCPMMQT